MERIETQIAYPKDQIPSIKPHTEPQLIKGGPINPDLERRYLKTRARLIEELGIHLEAEK